MHKISKGLRLISNSKNDNKWEKDEQHNWKFGKYLTRHLEKKFREPVVMKCASFP